MEEDTDGMHGNNPTGRVMYARNESSSTEAVDHHLDQHIEPVSVIVPERGAVPDCREFLFEDFTTTIRKMELRSFSRWYTGAHERSWGVFTTSLLAIFAGLLNVTAFQGACGVSILSGEGSSYSYAPLTTVAAILIIFALDLSALTVGFTKYSVFYTIGNICIDCIYLLVIVAAAGAKTNEEDLGPKSTTFLGQSCSNSYGKYFLYHWYMVAFYTFQLGVVLCDIAYHQILGRIAIYYFLKSNLFVNSWQLLRVDEVKLYVPAKSTQDISELALLAQLDARTPSMRQTTTAAAAKHRKVHAANGNVVANGNNGRGNTGRSSSYERSAQQPGSAPPPSADDTSVSLVPRIFIQNHGSMKDSGSITMEGTAEESPPGQAMMEDQAASRITMNQPRIMLVDGLHVECCAVSFLRSLGRKLLCREVGSIEKFERRAKQRISFTGEISNSVPHGFGYWSANTKYGEKLVGYWTEGAPSGPYKSREVGSGSGFMCIRIGWASCVPQSGRGITQNVGQTQNLKFGIADVECSVSGKFFKGFPEARFGEPPENRPMMPTLFDTAKLKLQEMLVESRKIAVKPVKGVAEIAKKGQRRISMNVLQGEPQTARSSASQLQLPHSHQLFPGLIEPASRPPSAGQSPTIEGTSLPPSSRRWSAFLPSFLDVQEGDDPPRTNQFHDLEQQHGQSPPDLQPQEQQVQRRRSRQWSLGATAVEAIKAIPKKTRDVLRGTKHVEAQDEMNLVLKYFHDVQWMLANLSPHTPNFGLQPRSEMSISVDRERGVAITGHVPVSELVVEVKNIPSGPALLCKGPAQGGRNKQKASGESPSSDDLQQDLPVTQHRPDMSSMELGFGGLGAAAVTSATDNSASVRINIISRPLMGFETTAGAAGTTGATGRMAGGGGTAAPATAVEKTHEMANLGNAVFAPELEAKGWLPMELIGTPEVLLYIHGYNNTHYESCQILGQLAAFGNFPNHLKLVLFSWPAGRGFLEFYNARRAAEDRATHEHLYAVLIALRDNGIRNIHILCHSMGSRLFFKALRWMREDKNLFAEIYASQARPVEGTGRLRILTATLLNPEYFVDDFVEYDYYILRGFCGHISIYADASDKALWYSETFSRRAALGRAIFDLRRRRPSSTTNDLAPTAPVHLNATDIALPRSQSGSAPQAVSLSKVEVHRHRASSPSLPSRPQSPQRGMTTGTTPQLRMLDTISFFQVSKFKLDSDITGDNDFSWLDLDVIDTTFVDQNVHALRHSFWNLNREIIEDVRELLVTKKRAKQRTGRLDRREGNVWVFRVAPSFMKSLFSI